MEEKKIKVLQSMKRTSFITASITEAYRFYREYDNDNRVEEFEKAIDKWIVKL